MKATTFHHLLQYHNPILLNCLLEKMMTKELTKKEMNSDLLASKIEEAGYEVEVDEDGDVSILNTGFNTRIEVFEDSGILRFRAGIVLNQNAANQDVETLVAELNKRIFLPKFVYHRWDDGDLAIFAHHIIHFPFGLNVPNLLFSLRRFLEGVAGARTDFVKDTAFDPNFVGAKPALPAPEQVQ
jgi:hypothetical protein